MELQELIQRIDALKAEIDAVRPLSSDVEGRIMQKLRLDWNYHSSNIEGNTLTYGETKTFLLHGLTAEGKPLKDHLEIRGHNDAIFELEDIVRQRKPLTQHVIKGLHQLILGREPFPIPARTSDGYTTERTVTPGRYKVEPNHVRTATGETFYFASPEDTQRQMDELMEWYEQAVNDPDLHPLILAASFHYKFILIHPFDDGNGRVARLLMNLVFMMYGYPPAIIQTTDKENYYRALRQADGGDLEAFVEYIGEQELRSCEIYVRGAKGEEIEEEGDIEKQIELFKVGVIREHDQPAPMRWSVETQNELYERVIYPIIESVGRTLGRFNDLFVVREDVVDLRLWNYDNPVRRSVQTLQDVADLSILIPAGLKEDPAYRLALELRWRGFRQGGTNTFDVVLQMIFRLDEFKFELRATEDGEILLGKRYEQTISDTEIRDLVRRYSETMMQEITRKRAAGN